MSRSTGAALVSRCGRALTRSHHCTQASTRSMKLPYAGSRFASVGTRSALATLTVCSTPPLDCGSNGSHVWTVQP